MCQVKVKWGNLRSNLGRVEIASPTFRNQSELNFLNRGCTDRKFIPCRSRQHTEKKHALFDISKEYYMIFIEHDGLPAEDSSNSWSIEMAVESYRSILGSIKSERSRIDQML